MNDYTERQLREKVREALADYHQWIDVAARAEKPYVSREELLVIRTQIESAKRVLWMEN